MNKLEQLHFEAITEAEFSNYSGHSEGQEVAAIKSAEITEQIAVEFAEWMADNRVSLSAKRRDSEQFFYQGKEINSKEVFQEFLKTKQ